MTEKESYINDCWLAQNADYAACSVFYRTVGYLRAAVVHGSSINAKDILNFMTWEHRDEVERLNVRYPEKR
jgi:hypothetical protein